jgi:hypothetical protein
MAGCVRAVREFRAYALKQVSPLRPAHLENDSALLNQLTDAVPRHANIVPDFSERRHLPRFANSSFRNFADPLTPLAKIMFDLCEQGFKEMFTNRMHARQLSVSLQLRDPPVRLRDSRWQHSNADIALCRQCAEKPSEVLNQIHHVSLSQVSETFLPTEFRKPSLRESANSFPLQRWVQLV